MLPVNSNSRLGKISVLFIQRRWWGFGFLSLLIFVFEYSQHPRTVAGLDPHMLSETGLYLTLLLGLTLIMEVLWTTLQEKDRAYSLLDAKHEISIKLSTTQSWDELNQAVIQYTEKIAPIKQASLLLYRPESGHFDLVAHSSPNGSSAPAAPIDFSTEACLACALENPNLLHPSDGCIHNGSPAFHFPNSYCLPLSYGNAPLGKLQFQITDSQELLPAQIEILNSIGPELGVSLVLAQMEQSREETQVKLATEEVRNSIARDLHDTLSQNISFLRLKLEQLTLQKPSGNLGDILPDLANMQVAANQSYELLRGTLATIQPDSYTNLADLLYDHANQVCERAGMKLQFTSQGERFYLTPFQVSQIFYIFQEKLNNIEKHSGAAQLTVKLAWEEGEFYLQVADNGRGFDPLADRPRGHYGLDFIQQRAGELGGSVELRSSPGAGTALTLRVPG
jgi:signal transduction histidine kinase